MKVWKIGIIGCGNIAQTVYLPQMSKLPHAQVTAVCDTVAERAETVAESFNIPECYTCADEFLAKADVEIVMSIAAIQGRHELNIKILRAGKHLYSQKPFAPTVQAASEQIEAAAAKGLKISAAPVHRNRPDIRQVKQLIDAGAIGHISLMKISVAHGGPEYYQFRDTDPSWFYRSGAGALLDMGVHGIDQVIALLGPAKYVSCMAAVSEPRRIIRSGCLDGKVMDTNEIPDNYLISLDFDNGTLSMVTSGFIQKASLTETGGFEIYGDRGTINLSHGTAYSGIGDVKLYLDKPELGLRGWIDPLPIKEPQQEYFQCLCIADLIEAIENDHPSSLFPEHARHVIEIMNAIPQSIKEGRKIALATTFGFDYGCITPSYSLLE